MKNSEIGAWQKKTWTPKLFAQGLKALRRLEVMRDLPVAAKVKPAVVKEYEKLRTAVGPLFYWPAERWPRPKPGAAPFKVAIVGKANSRIHAPWGQPGWELWGLNDTTVCPKHPGGCEGIPPVKAHTRWFQLHPPRYLKVHYPQGIDNLKVLWTRRNGVRLYMDQHYKAYPMSEPYPKAKVERMVPHGAYHASSFDWLLALAILEGFKEIHLYGVAIYTPPVMNGEPLSARPCMEYWVGVAEGRGSKVVAHGEGDLFKIIHAARLVSELQYGWDHEPGLDLARDGKEAWKDWR